MGCIGCGGPSKEHIPYQIKVKKIQEYLQSRKVLFCSYCKHGTLKKIASNVYKCASCRRRISK